VYITQVIKNTCGELEILIQAVVLMLRLHHRNGIPLDGLTVHRLFLGCYVLAYKFYDDWQVPNKAFARCGGISLRELNVLEQKTAKLLDWNFGMSSQLYNKMIRRVVQSFQTQPKPQTEAKAKTKVSKPRRPELVF
jgi:hypothetical protein